MDATGFPQRGTASVGVAWQDAGTLGQGGPWQLAGTCGATDPQATWPVAGRLSLPQPWAPAPERRQQARVPAAGAVQTTPEMAWARLEQARAWGVRHGGVVAAAAAGDNPHFLTGLAARQEPDGVGVRPAFQVRLGRTARPPVWRADAWLQRVPRAGHRHAGGLVGARAPQGQPEARQDSWSTLPAAARLEERAGDAPRRQAVAPCQEAAPGELGGDQDQGRLWPGVHRHAVIVRLAGSVLVGLERRQRRRRHRLGRPRDALSPSAGAPEQDTPGRAS